MKSFIVAAVLSVLAFGANAQQTSDHSVVTIQSPGPIITLPSEPRLMSAQEFGKFVGSYELSNGKLLSLFVRGETKYAVIQGEARHELVAKSGNSFVAKDKQLALTIELHDMAEPTGEVLLMEPAEGVAANGRAGHLVRIALH